MVCEGTDSIRGRVSTFGECRMSYLGDGGSEFSLLLGDVEDLIGDSDGLSPLLVVLLTLR